MNVMNDQSNDPKAPSHDCSDWTEIVRCLESFPSSEVNYAEGDVTKTDWVFRGLADACYRSPPLNVKHVPRTYRGSRSRN